MQKLDHYGIRGIINDWFSSYLLGRSQVTEVDAYLSSKSQISCGVPQGSVLGPLLFLIYISDIHSSSDKLSFYLFADDTNLLYADKNLKSLEETVNNELLKVSEWLNANKLRPRLYGEKLSRVEGSPAYPSYPGRANLSYISLQNLANRLHEKQKVGSARRVTRLAGSPFCDGRVTLLAGPIFLHINTLARLAGSTPSRRDNQSMRELCCHWERKNGGQTEV